MTHAFHPLAEVFPPMEGPEFDALVEDVREHGVENPVTLYEERILDGRNRVRAAIEAGCDYPTELYLGDDPLGLVISRNVKRRHLNESQRAIIAAKLANMRQGERTDLPSIAGRLISQEQAARRLNVSVASVERARGVLESATPELRNAVEHGAASVSAAAEIAKLPEEEQRNIVAHGSANIVSTAKSLRKREHRHLREVALAEKQAALPEKRYGVILADPPWRFEPYSRDTGMDRATENHYSTITTGKIAGLPVPDIAAPDCALFIWATIPMIEASLFVLKTWGFEYKSHCIWAKPRIGTGYWFRQKHELLLVGTRGKIPAPALGDQAHSVIEAPVGEHSQKPERFYEIIEGYFPTLPKIELFARAAREGWDVWGNEAPMSDSQFATDIENTQGRSGTAREAPSTGSGTTAATPSVGVQPAAPFDSEDPEEAADGHGQDRRPGDACDLGGSEGEGTGNQAGGEPGRAGARNGHPPGDSEVGAVAPLSAEEVRAEDHAVSDAADPFGRLTYHPRPPPELPDFDGERDLRFRRLG